MPMQKCRKKILNSMHLFCKIKLIYIKLYYMYHVNYYVRLLLLQITKID